MFERIERTHLLRTCGAWCAILSVALGCAPSAVPSSEAQPSDDTRHDEGPPWQQLGGADLRGTSFENARLARAILVDADLRGVSLRGADLRGACIMGAQLDGADLRGADLSTIDFHHPGWRDAYGAMGPPRDSAANLDRASLPSADLRAANLHSATLVDADLRSAQLQGAQLDNADLRGARLDGADLSKAKLCNADLQGAILVDVRWQGAELRGAWLHDAVLPADLASVATSLGAILTPRPPPAREPCDVGAKSCSASKHCGG